MAAPAQGPEVGETLAGRYKLVQEIGRGGFGVVFRATQLGMNRDVAVKLLHASGPPGQEAQMRDRFKREAMMARNLNHPHTIRQYDFGETDDGMMYLVLEFLEGQNLVEVIRSEGALEDARVRRMAEGVLKSLSEAHSQGIVHRDLKPANIMLCNVYGEKDYVKVLDFGIAKTVMGDTDLTAAGVAMGSPRYMAPELLRGENPAPGSDVYSVAITFAEAVMGKPLIRAENSVEAAQMQLSPKPLPVPNELKRSALWPWLSIALKKAESERFQNAEEMLRYLNATPAELAARGAEIEGQAPPQANLAENTRPQVNTRRDPDETSDLDEDSDVAPTIRIDSADVDAYLATRSKETPPASVDLAATRDETRPKLASQNDWSQTRPSQDALKRPQLPPSETSGELRRHSRGVDDERATSPLPQAHRSDPAVHPAFPPRSHDSSPALQVGEESGESPTQMVSVEEAFRAASVPHSFAQGPSNDEPLQHVFQGGPPVVSSDPAPSGDQATQMISLEQGDQGSMRTQGAHRAETGSGMGPQISGQAFSDAAVEGGSRTEFVPAVTGDRSGVSDAKRKKYLLLLVALIGVGVAGALALGFIVLQLAGKGEQVATPPPTIVAPTEPAIPAVATVEFKVFSTPPAAALLIDGAEKGQTPAKFKLTEDRLPLDVELVLEGHERRTIRLEKGGQTTFDLKLEELPQPEPEKPEAQEKPAEEAESEPAPKPKPKPKPKPEKKKPVIEIWD